MQTSNNMNLFQQPHYIFSIDPIKQTDSSYSIQSLLSELDSIKLDYKLIEGINAKGDAGTYIIMRAPTIDYKEDRIKVMDLMKKTKCGLYYLGSPSGFTQIFDMKNRVLFYSPSRDVSKSYLVSKNAFFLNGNAYTYKFTALTQKGSEK